MSRFALNRTRYRIDAFPATFLAECVEILSSGMTRFFKEVCHTGKCFLPQAEGARHEKTSYPVSRAGFLALGISLLPLASWAACGSPSGAQGDMMYNSSVKVAQYCDGSNWIAMHLPGSGSGGCTNPTATAGTLTHNSSTATLQACAGNQWMAVLEGVSGGGGTTSSADITTGLTGHWKLDETTGTNAADATGTSDGIVYPGAPPGDETWEAGNINNAYRFSGTNDNQIRIPEAPFDFGSYSAFTVSAWVKNDIGAGAGKNNIASFWEYDGGGGPRSWLLTHHSNDQYFFELYGKGNISGGSVSTSWAHVVGTYDASTGYMRLYLNGSEVASQSGLSGNLDDATGTSNMHIGSQTDSNNVFDGLIDDVRIYDRALNASEVLELYALGNSLSDGLVGHWKLDETTGTTAYDSTGNGHDLTLYNTDATVWAQGKIVNALNVDGNDDDIRRDAGSLALAGESALTVSAWVNATGCGSGESCINDVAGVESGSDDQYKLLFDNAGSTGNYGILLNLHTTGGEVGEERTYVFDPIEGVWYHIAFTWDAGTTTTYLDGVQVDQRTLGGGVIETHGAGDTFRIGEGKGTFEGLIDDVRVYDRALSAGEVSLLAALGCSSPAAPSGAVVFNSTHNVLQYCNAGEWRAVGAKQ